MLAVDCQKNGNIVPQDRFVKIVLKIPGIRSSVVKFAECRRKIIFRLDRIPEPLSGLDL